MNGLASAPQATWLPDPAFIKTTNIYKMMQELGLQSYAELHRWSVENRLEFWQLMIYKLGIHFQKPYQQIVDLNRGVEYPNWLPGAKLNIAESCFLADPSTTAIIYGGNNLQRMTFDELRRLSNRVANSLRAIGLKQGDAIAIDMVMTADTVAIYLGAIFAGISVVGIADSFAADEIATRIRLGRAKVIFTQDYVQRAGKSLPMYEKVAAAKPEKIVMLSYVRASSGEATIPLRRQDMRWDKFLKANDQFSPVPCNPNDVSNTLFSSGTTGDPKAIPWTHTTPIKCGTDAYLHHNIQPGDVLAWPTSLGWMMGPWLIYAAFLNRASIALYYDVAVTAEFGRFIQDAKVTMLGVVPSLVKSWRTSNCMQGADWSSIKCFSSTGECSNPDDMSFLMQLAGNKPIIEYCGGTEIGGGYITSTMVQPSVPSAFSTPALGIDYVIYNDTDQPDKNGELFIVPPSIGLSLTLLNKDHHDVYYADTPVGPHGELLRRHGDQMEDLGAGYYRAHGRVDDTMNLGGIKISCIEIEKSLNRVEGVIETAAIAVSPKGGGPSLLVIFAVMKDRQRADKLHIQQLMQESIKKTLNPLFRIHDLVFIDSLPRTASNKVMRRVLRAQYQANA